MSDYYSVSEYARVVGKDTGNIRRLLIKGIIKGEKIGNQWIIPKETLYPRDRRLKSGRYKNWRNRREINIAKKEFFNNIIMLCEDLSEVYGELLAEVVLYGEYNIWESTKEKLTDNPIDIALILHDEGSKKMHDAMIDTVVDYEFNQGIELSVVSIDYKQYNEHKASVSLYREIYEKGVIIWKNNNSFKTIAG